jgi:hypothetical protein
MPRGFLILVLSLTACGAGTPDSGDSRVDDSGDSEDTAPCEVLTDGTYEARGSCFGMTMTVALDMDDAACSFVLDDWSMNHGDLPESGSIDGDQVTLAGPGFDGCTGTVDGDAVSGTCDDGCAWELSRD